MPAGVLESGESYIKRLLKNARQIIAGAALAAQVRINPHLHISYPLADTQTFPHFIDFFYYLV